MSSENWKLEKDLCRCCHSEGSFKNLAEPFKIADLAEIYADMLKECYDIDMAPVPGLLCAATYTICEVCVMRLRDASDFKKQVLSCEERFRDMYNRNVIKASDISVEIEVKQEIPDSEPEDEFKEELSLHDNDDEDYDESMELKISEEEDETSIEVEARKKRKIKTRTSAKNTTVKKKKNTKRKTLKQEPADTENDAERKQGRVLAPFLSAGRVVTPFLLSECQIVPPKFFLREEDYNKNGDAYQCVRCERIYNKMDSLRIHVKLKHYKIPKYKCPICIEGFMTLPQLTVHKLEVHNVDDRVKCSLCSKIFNTKIQLNIHINQFHMHGEVGARYKCEFCDYVTFKYVALYKHKFKHKTVKDHHCRFCKKSFKRKSTLNLHEKIHTDDRSKVCTVCGHAFVQKASLNYHMTKYHPEVNF